jgi:spore germination protein
MLILHKVRPEDTISSIAEQYNIPIHILLQENDLSQNSVLNEGEIITITYPTQTYKVKEGDTLSDIALANGVSVIELLRNNPFLSDRVDLIIGEELIISYDNKNKKIRVNGMTFSFINLQVLKKTLPFLTYITVMGYKVDVNGYLSDVNDIDIIQMALSYSVVPLMLISTLDETGHGSYDISHSLFTNPSLQKTLVDNIIVTLDMKGYYGAVFGFQFVLREDQQNYMDFIEYATRRIHDAGYLSWEVLIPTVFGYIQEAPNFTEINQAVDGIILLSYQWSTNYIPNAYQTTYTYIKDYLDTVLTMVSPEKIYLGLTRIAYDWELPYVEGESFVSSLTDPRALRLAGQYGSEILFDETTQMSYFMYNEDGTEHMVWFSDIRNTNAILNLVNDYGLGGISVWTIMYFSRIWLSINSQYDIEKLLPVE